jgi:hypothetical protein
MSAQTIEIRTGRGIASKKVWFVVALAVALIVVFALIGPGVGTAGDTGRPVPTSATTPSHTMVVGGGQSQGHPLP